MGEAKRRGTYEERKTSAIEREKNKPRKEESEIISNGKGLAELLALLGMMSGYNPFIKRKSKIEGDTDANTKRLEKES